MPAQLDPEYPMAIVGSSVTSQREAKGEFVTL